MNSFTPHDCPACAHRHASRHWRTAIKVMLVANFVALAFWDARTFAEYTGGEVECRSASAQPSNDRWVSPAERGANPAQRAEVAGKLDGEVSDLDPGHSPILTASRGEST